MHLRDIMTATVVYDVPVRNHTRPKEVPS